MRYSVLALLLISGCFLFHREKSLPDTSKQHLIISVDRTKSMRLSDPEGRAVDLASALPVLLPPESYVSAVAVGEESRTLLERREITSRSDRIKMEKYLRGQGSLGASFDYEKALNDATRLADGVQPAVPPSFIFISDGYNETKSTPDRALLGFQKNKWSIDTAVVTPKTVFPFLSYISEKTGGSILKVETLSDFVFYLKRFYPNWRLFKSIPEVGAPLNKLKIVEQTYRLFVLTARGLNDSYLTEASFTGEKKEQKISRFSSSVSAYPYRADKVKSVFDIVNFEMPPAGECILSFSQKPQDCQVWAILPLSVKIDSFPDTITEGEELTVRITVSVDSKETLTLLKLLEEGNLSARLVSKEGVTPPVEFPLSPVTPPEKATTSSVKEEKTPTEAKKETPKEAAKEKEKPKAEEVSLSKTYEGKTRIFLRKRANEKFMLVVKAVLRYPRTNMWVSEQEFSLLVKASEIPVIVDPSRLSFAPCWVDEISPSIQLQLKTEYPHKLIASVTDFPEWVRITPNNVPLTRGIAAQFALSVSPDANTIPGARRGNISILVKTEDGNEFSRLSIPVSATLLKLDMRKDVETVLHPGGEFEVEIGKPIEPSVTLDFKEVKKDETGKIKVLRLESKGERLVLIVSVAEDAEESQSELILEVAPKEYKVKSKSIRINALVRASPKLTVKPQEVVLAVEKGGDYEAKLELLLDHYENVELESTISDLIGEEKHKLSANAGEVKVTEKLTLEPGKTSELKLDFLVSPDIHSGVYKGEATLTLKYHKGERQTSLKVPIKLEIKK